VASTEDLHLNQSVATFNPFNQGEEEKQIEEPKSPTIALDIKEEPRA